MVFFALCMQCGATVAIIARELNWRWAALSFFGMTTLAWLSAVLIYQAGRFFFQ
jgi:ferrous iron transport protein B